MVWQPAPAVICIAEVKEEIPCDQTERLRHLTRVIPVLHPSFLAFLILLVAKIGRSR